MASIFDTLLGSIEILSSVKNNLYLLSCMWMRVHFVVDLEKCLCINNFIMFRIFFILVIVLFWTICAHFHTMCALKIIFELLHSYWYHARTLQYHVGKENNSCYFQTFARTLVPSAHTSVPCAPTSKNLIDNFPGRAFLLVDQSGRVVAWSQISVLN